MGSRSSGGAFNRRRVTGALLALAVAGCAPGSGAAPGDTAPVPSSEPVTREMALAVFDSAWSRVQHAYYDTTFHGLDWAAIGQEYREQAGGAGSADSLRAVIQSMVERLGDSHFLVIPASAADALDPDSTLGSQGDPGDVGLETRIVDGRLMISRADPGLPGARAGVRPGWILEAIGPVPASRFLGFLEPLSSQRRLAEARVAFAANARLAGRVGDTVALRLLDGAGREVEVPVVPVPIRGTPVRFGNLPTMFASLDSRAADLGEAGCVGVIRFNIWMTPILPAFDDAVQSLRRCRGMVLDLRGNPGGVAGMVMGISGYFMDEQKELGVMTTRQGQLHLRSMPRHVTRQGKAMQPFAGPLALLVDGETMSTSEIFSAALQELGRARVFGDTTGGQALPAILVRLPNRDVLMHPIANLVGPDGNRVEGRGVVPDVVTPLTRKDLLAGRDATLEAALRWIEHVHNTDAAAMGARAANHQGASR